MLVHDVGVAADAVGVVLLPTLLSLLLTWTSEGGLVVVSATEAAANETEEEEEEEEFADAGGVPQPFKAVAVVVEAMDETATAFAAAFKEQEGEGEESNCAVGGGGINIITQSSRNEQLYGMECSREERATTNVYSTSLRECRWP